MPETLEFGKPEWPRRQLRAGLAGLVVVAAAAGGFALECGGDQVAHPSQSDQTGAAKVHFWFGPGNEDLVFSPSGSRLTTTSGEAGFSIVDQEHAQVSFDGLHCADSRLRGEMTVARSGGATLVFNDVAIPDRQPTVDCLWQNTLPNAYIAQLVIAGQSYDYAAAQ